MMIATAFVFPVFARSYCAEVVQPKFLITSQHHSPIIIHEHHGRNVTSSNWSGYAVTGADGSVTDVKGSWIVPAIQGSCGTANSYSSFWVGIDGFSSNTVEQIGTDSDCHNGVPTYYAWFEFYPHPSFTISLSIKPGDVISANVHYGGAGKFTVSLQDVTTGRSFSTSVKMSNARRSSAEWIAEAPSSGGVLPLANFGTADYGMNYTNQSNTCYAKVGTTAGPIGSFESNKEITMVNSSGATKAIPSGLSPDGSSFSDSWISANFL